MQISGRGVRVSIIAIPLALATAFSSRQERPVVPTEQRSNTTERLVAVSAPTSSVAWASGAKGTYVRTTDGGTTWTAAQVPGAESLDFRDVHAIDNNVAFLLAAGNGDKSRIYKTTDAGTTWKLQFTNKDPAGFYDCFDFWDEKRGIVIGDAINGELAILTTEDGGDHWTRVPPSTLPTALNKEGSFASSGTCIVTGSRGRAWFGTTKSRVIRTLDYGKTWKVSLTPMTSSDSTGVPSISFRDNNNGLAFGGYGAAAGDTIIAITGDGGATWSGRNRPPIASGLFGGAYVQSGAASTVVVVGPKGSAYSRDHGLTWARIDTLNYWGLAFAPGAKGWAVGARGRITMLTGF